MPDSSSSQRWWQHHRVDHRTKERSAGSRWLYRIDHYSSQSVVALAAGAFLVAAFAVGLGLGFPAGWAIAFETITASLTLVMVFAIQHTQAREQAATQRKLDELLRVLPGARAGLMLLEEASEDEMAEVEQGHRDAKQYDAG
jgi:low affinity Fe/Cu permease